MKKILIPFMMSAMALAAFADSFSLSSKEQQQMLNEADDWIDDIPEGLQDRLSDAVDHALHGFFSEIQYFRNINDTTGISKYPVNVKDLQLNGITTQMKLYSPLQKKGTQNLPVLIYFHGGGWSVGSPAVSDKFCRALVSKGNLMIISVDYPLAPEHPYPAALMAAEEAVKEVVSTVSQLGSDASSISLGGDGAGGNIALSVYDRLPDSVNIKSLVLYYPLINTKRELDPEGKRKFGRGYGFDSRVWEAFIRSYQANFSDYKKALPPTLLIAPGRDIIINEEREFSSFDNVKYIEFTGAIHGFITDGQQKTAFNKAVELTDLFLTR